MRFVIEVEVERVTGLFASRDEIGSALEDALNDADVSGVGANGDSEYEITSVAVQP